LFENLRPPLGIQVRRANRQGLRAVDETEQYGGSRIRIEMRIDLPAGLALAQQLSQQHSHAGAILLQDLAYGGIAAGFCQHIEQNPRTRLSVQGVHEFELGDQRCDQIGAAHNLSGSRCGVG